MRNVPAARIAIQGAIAEKRMYKNFVPKQNIILFAVKRILYLYFLLNV